MEWLILVIISAIFIALRTIFTKKILVKNNVLPLLFFVSLISSIFMLIFYKKIKLDLSYITYLLIILKSLIITGSWYCIYQAYKKLNISTVSPLRNLSPIFLIILSLIFLNEKVSFINYFGIFIIIISAYSLETKSFLHFLEPLNFFKSKYFLLIVLSLIGGSISAILDKILIKQTNFHTIMFLFYVFLTLSYLFILLIKKQIKSLKIFSEHKNIILILFISIFALIADFSYFAAVAIPNTLIILIIPLRRLSTFISTLIGGKFFHEKHLLHKSIICLLMIIGVFLINL